MNDFRADNERLRVHQTTAEILAHKKAVDLFRWPPLLHTGGDAAGGSQRSEDAHVRDGVGLGSIGGSSAVRVTVTSSRYDYFIFRKQPLYYSSS